MRANTSPLIRPILAAGPGDRVFDILLLVGPLLIILIAILGRNLLSVTIAAAYIATFVGYIVYKGL